MAGHLHKTFNTCTGKTKYKTEQSENHKKKTSVIQNFSITVTNFSNNNIHNIKKKCNSKYPHTWCTYRYVSACGWWVSWTVWMLKSRACTWRVSHHCVFACVALGLSRLQMLHHTAHIQMASGQCVNACEHWDWMSVWTRLHRYCRHRAFHLWQWQVSNSTLQLTQCTRNLKCYSEEQFPRPAVIQYLLLVMSSTILTQLDDL